MLPKNLCIYVLRRKIVELLFDGSFFGRNFPIRCRRVRFGQRADKLSQLCLLRLLNYGGKLSGKLLNGLLLHMAMNYE